MYKENAYAFNKEFKELHRQVLDREKQDTPIAMWHYTSLKGFYNIMESDSLWASNTRFSNDLSEETLIGEDWLHKVNYNDDNYIISFCGSKDLLSAWRGYCPFGGVAFKLDIAEIQSYSILHSDYDITMNYEQYYNSPLPVFYIDMNEELSNTGSKVNQQYKMNPEFKKSLDDVMTNYTEEKKDETKWSIVPYLKHGKFYEEIEWRLVFTNHNNELSSCIRYRDTNDHTKVPYMVVKFGDIGKNKMSCKLNFKEYSEDKLKDDEHIFGRKIIIPEGSNQESTYNKMYEIITNYNKSVKRNQIKLFCAGHIPVRNIIIAPMYNKERIKEQIDHYCKSKYWLRDVKVTCSEIPYIPSANKVL